MSGIADDVVELLDGYQQALADAAIVRGADPDAAWAEALRRANAYWERRDRDLPVTCAARHEAAWNEREYAVGKIAELEAENAKLRELAVLNWEWAHSCCGNNCKMQTDGCGYQIDCECNYEREIYDRMRELGIELNDYE